MIPSSVIRSMRQISNFLSTHLSFSIMYSIFLFFEFSIIFLMFYELFFGDWFSGWVNFLELSFSLFDLLLHNILNVLFFFDSEERFFPFVFFHKTQKLFFLFLLNLLLFLLMLTDLYISLFECFMSLFFHLLFELFVLHCTFDFQRFHFLCFSNFSLFLFLLLSSDPFDKLLGFLCPFT